MSNVLENYAFYVSETISNKELNKHNFISVDNMLPNGEGIKEADYVPTEGTSIKFRRNDILIGNIRPYFKKIWMAEFDGGCSADVLCIRAKDSISPEYLLFYCKILFLIMSCLVQKELECLEETKIIL